MERHVHSIGHVSVPADTKLLIASMTRGGPSPKQGDYADAMAPGFRATMDKVLQEGIVLVQMPRREVLKRKRREEWEADQRFLECD